MKTIVTSALLALSILGGVSTGAVGGIEEAFGTRTSPLQAPSNHQDDLQPSHARYIRSKIPAAPMPPPMHMVTMP